MLKLAKLPDRTTTKITFSASAKLNEDLHGYEVLYRNTYGETASVSELIPFMLESFLERDHAFTKARREGKLETGIEKETSTQKPVRPHSQFPCREQRRAIINYPNDNASKGRMKHAYWQFYSVERRRLDRPH